MYEWYIKSFTRMPRLSNELRKAAIHMKDGGYSTSRIKKTLMDRGQISRRCDWVSFMQIQNT